MPLSKRQMEVLRLMQDSGTEIVYERGLAFVDDWQISARTVFSLIRRCAISLDPHSEVGGFERYTINSTGRDLLRESGASTPKEKAHDDDQR